MTGPEIRWVSNTGDLLEVTFTEDELEQLRQGRAVTSYSPSHPVRRWTNAEARAHLERRLGEIEARQDELRRGGCRPRVGLLPATLR